MEKPVLILGSGGREHALAWKLNQSPHVGKVFCSPGNAGIARVAECVNLNGTEEIVAFCRAQNVSLVVIGPEQPLVDGASDALRKAGIPVFGPSRAAAQLEASKGFTKHLCKKYHIPTAAYEMFTDEKAALAYVETQAFPLVIKADGLAAGKGVIIAAEKEEAREAVRYLFSGALGEAGKTVVIEEFLVGEEVSFFALADGRTAIPFSYAQDHKRAHDGDQGPNTGGMGTYAPPPVFTSQMQKRVMDDIIHPTMDAMAAEGAPFSGVLFAGLMLTPSGPKLLEYNVRFGDPETQSMMRRLESDLFPVLLACAQGDVSQAQLRFTPDAALCVVMATRGYPGAYEKGSVIRGLAEAEKLPGVVIFHAGTASKENDIVATGGRVLGVTATGATIPEAKARAYAAVDSIDWPEGFCRRDIGWRAIHAA